MPQIMQQIETMADKSEAGVEKVGNYLVEGFQFMALFVIGGTIVWSAISTYLDIMSKGSAAIDDILLLFIFLELGAMVGIYFKTNRLPVQFLIYVAITVMTRSLASSLSIKNLPDERILSITGSILLLAIAVFVLRYTTSKLPPFISHSEPEEGGQGQRPNDLD